MSRTYRKSRRCFWKHRGAFYNTYDDRTVKGIEDYIFDDWRTGNHDTQGANYFIKIVKTSDGGNYHRGAGKAHKTMCHRIDRARFRQALINNEDAIITTYFDPWDWD